MDGDGCLSCEGHGEPYNVIDFLASDCVLQPKEDLVRLDRRATATRKTRHELYLSVTF